jgi:hypothetical protein
MFTLYDLIVNIIFQFSVYDMSLDTMLLCFCEDSSRNDGSAEKPYFMSDSLKHFVDNHHKHGCCSAPEDHHGSSS